VVIVPRPALRPTLGVTWESAGAPGQALQVTLGVPDAKPDTRVNVWVLALRPGVTCPDDAEGKLDREPDHGEEVEQDCGDDEKVAQLGELLSGHPFLLRIEP
jgi:hypothetical protein